jgi:hypothetical protein
MCFGGKGGMGLSIGRRIFSKSTAIEFLPPLELMLLDPGARTASAAVSTRLFTAPSIQAAVLVQPVLRIADQPGEGDPAAAPAASPILRPSQAPGPSIRRGRSPHLQD